MSDGSNSRLMFCSKKVITMNTLLHEKIKHKIYEEPLDTNQGPKGMKWIFVTSTSKKLYAEKVVCQNYALSFMLNNVISCYTIVIF